MRLAGRALAHEALLFCLLCILLALSASLPLSAQTATLAQVRKTVSAAKTPETLLTALRGSLTSMQPRDALALLEEFEPKVPAASRADIRCIISGLHQLMGQAKQAAVWARRAAELDSRYLMQAFRFALAAGDVASAIEMQGRMSEQDSRHLLAEAWLFLLDGQYEAILRSAIVAPGSVEQALRRELMFLAFLAETGKKGSASTFASSIIREFPRSAEAALVQGNAAVSTDFILLSGIAWGSSPAALQPARNSGTKSQDSKASSQTVPSPSGPSTNEERWLQTGYFSSRENAERFSRTLASLGFRTRVVEARSSSGEPRWAVHVAGGDNWQKTQSALKDQGFESYLVP